MIIILGHRNWKMGLFFLLMRKLHSGKAHGGKFGLFKGVLWSVPKKPEDMD